jgi:hypothetical protein
VAPHCGDPRAHRDPSQIIQENFGISLSDPAPQTSSQSWLSPHAHTVKKWWLAQRNSKCLLERVVEDAYAAGKPATATSAATPNTLTYNTPFGIRNNANNNLVYSPRQIQLGVRVQF